MLTLSASRIKLYQSCRATYHDQYILKNTQPLNTSALMGSALHKAIEYNYRFLHDPIKGNPRRVFDAYMMRMYDYWNKSGKEFKEYESFMDLLKTGRGILATFPWSDYRPLRQELAFELPFTEHTGIKGYIDMIDNGSFVDFKSAKNPPKDLQNDTQFIMYAWAYRQIYHMWPHNGIWHHLRTNKQIEFVIFHGEIKRQIDALKVLAETIYADTFTDIQPCAKCPPWCKFKKEIKHATIQNW